MKNTPFHPQKTTLIEHVSDDIRSIKASDVEQQKILLSGRAINDLLKGDRFDYDNVSDLKYFEHVDLVDASIDTELVENRENPDWAFKPKATAKVNFNAVLEASIRYLDAEGYVNGPAGIAFGGFLHTASVLGSESLTYDAELAASHGADEGYSIRQIFYPEDKRDFEAFTRVGRYVEVDVDGTIFHKIEWSAWFQLSGRLLRVLVTSSTDAVIQTANLRMNTIYELHMGGAEIVLPNADNCAAGMCLVFEQYHNESYVYQDVDTTGATPNPLKRYYIVDETTDAISPAGNNGYISEFEVGKQYRVRTEEAAWTNTIKYRDDGLDRDYELQTIPDLSMMRASESAENTNDWYRGNSGAVQYRFEVIDRAEPMPVVIDNVTYRSTHMWAIDVDNDAVQRYADFAELLDAHTDPMLTDIVMYSERQFRSASVGGTVIPGNVDGDENGPYGQFVPKLNEALVVSRPASMNGVVKFEIEAVNLASITDNFNLSIYTFNESSSDFVPSQVFRYSPTSDATPNMYKRYYTYNEETESYVKAGADGYLSQFESGVIYYERTVNFESDIIPATFDIANASGVATEDVPAEFTKNSFNSQTKYTGYIHVNRNDTVMVVIKSDNHTKDQENVAVSVEVYPDPHDSYVMKPNISLDDAFTLARLNRMPKPGEPEDVVASAKALVNAFAMLANNLQSKGLLYGQRSLAPTANGNANIDTLTSPGLYTVNTATISGTIPTNMGNMTDAVNGELLVFTSPAYDAEVLLPKTESDTTAVNRSVTGNGKARVTQIYIGNGASGTDTYPTMWMRFALGSTNAQDQVSAPSWSMWVPLQPGPVVVPHTGDMSEADVKNALRYGSPNIVLSLNQGANIETPVVITLPDPAAYPNTKFKIEAVGCLVQIKYSKTVNGSTDEYSFISDKISTAPDHMLYPIESDGEYWYMVTVK